MQNKEFFFDGHCPECELKAKIIYLSLNKGDIFECPECRLMIALASISRATLISRRGSGNFKDLKNLDFSSKNIRGQLLVKESPDEFYKPDKFNTIKSDLELNDLLVSITKTDEGC